MDTKVEGWDSAQMVGDKSVESQTGIQVNQMWQGVVAIDKPMSHSCGIFGRDDTQEMSP